MKVEILRFTVSNWTTAALESDINSRDYIKDSKKVCNPYEVETIINDFCKQHKVIDIKVNTIDVKYHNNGRGNTVMLYYTIMYEE